MAAPSEESKPSEYKLPEASAEVPTVEDAPEATAVEDPATLQEPMAVEQVEVSSTPTAAVEDPEMSDSHEQRSPSSPQRSSSTDKQEALADDSTEESEPLASTAATPGHDGGSDDVIGSGEMVTGILSPAEAAPSDIQPEVIVEESDEEEELIEEVDPEQPVAVSPPDEASTAAAAPSTSHIDTGSTSSAQQTLQAQDLEEVAPASQEDRDDVPIDVDGSPTAAIESSLSPHSSVADLRQPHDKGVIATPTVVPDSAPTDSQDTSSHADTGATAGEDAAVTEASGHSAVPVDGAVGSQDQQHRPPSRSPTPPPRRLRHAHGPIKAVAARSQSPPIISPPPTSSDLPPAHDDDGPTTNAMDSSAADQTESHPKRSRPTPQRFSPPATRSRCTYQKLRLEAWEFWAVVIVPGCGVDHTKLKEQDAQHLGAATSDDLERSNVDAIALLHPELHVQLSLIIGRDLLDEDGNCAVLEAGEGAVLAADSRSARQTSRQPVMMTPEPGAAGAPSVHLTPSTGLRPRRGSSTARSTRTTPSARPTPSPSKRFIPLEGTPEAALPQGSRSGPSGAQDGAHATTSPSKPVTRATEAANSASEETQNDEAKEAGPTTLGGPLELQPASRTRAQKRKAEQTPSQTSGSPRVDVSPGGLDKRRVTRAAHAADSSKDETTDMDVELKSSPLASTSEIEAPPAVGTRSRKRKADDPLSQDVHDPGSSPSTGKRRATSQSKGNGEKDDANTDGPAAAAGRRGLFARVRGFLSGGRQ